MKEKNGNGSTGGKKDGVNPWPYIGAIGLFVFGVLGVYLRQFHNGFADQPDAWGQFGDYFGGVLNPVLSFCAFVGLLFTLRGQHADGLKAERRHQSQLDDERFFQLLNLLSKSSENFVYSPYGKAGRRSLSAGRLAFEAMWVSFSSGLGAGNVNETEAPRMYECLTRILGDWKPIYWPLIGIHFQLIFAVLEFVTKSGAPQSESVKFYMSLIKAQLSEEERLVAFYLASISREHLALAIFMRDTDFDEVAVLDDPLHTDRQVVLDTALEFHNFPLKYRL